MYASSLSKASSRSSDEGRFRLLVLHLAGSVAGERLMIRDLQYPDDARKTIDSLLAGLRYDASLAVMGNACPTLPLPPDGRPDFSSSIRCSGRSEDEAVRREAPGLLARLSLISMVSRIDLHAQNLLLQRRVL